MEKDKARVGDILDCIANIENYSAELDFESFLEKKIVQDAVVRNIEIIGEAAKKLSDEFKQQHPVIPWKKIMGMRDNLIHDYVNVDLGQVWQTIQVDIPALKQQLA